jgi:lysozyme family protein
MKPDLAALYDSALLTDAIRFAQPLAAIHAAQSRYQIVDSETGVPWQIIGILHQREASGNFHCHLHNGDPLTARTVHVPSGRPAWGTPPYKWEDSAVDALHYDNLTGLPDWEDIATALDRIERYNGLGYRTHGILSPYLWAGTNHYSEGKYTADGHFDAIAVDRQPGAAGLLKLLRYGSPTAEKSSVVPPSPCLTVTPEFQT